MPLYIVGITHYSICVVFSVQLLAWFFFFSNSDKVFHLFVFDIVGLAVVELDRLVGMVVDLVGMAVHLVGLVRGWVDAVVLVELKLVGLVDLVVDLVRLVVADLLRFP